MGETIKLEIGKKYTKCTNKEYGGWGKRKEGRGGKEIRMKSNGHYIRTNLSTKNSALLTKHPFPHTYMGFLLNLVWLVWGKCVIANNVANTQWSPIFNPKNGNFAV